MSATKQDSLPLTDSTAIVFNSGDSTKKVRISAASVATGTTRVLTVQDLDGTIAILSQPATFTTLAGTTSVVTPIVDSGAASALALKTNNGTTQVLIAHSASAVNFLSLQGGAAGNGVNILSSATSSDSNVGLDFGTKGTGVYNFYTRSEVASKKQFAILDTASADRNITVTGSNGGNPTIGVTAGSLAITPSVVIAGGALSLGSNPATTGGFNLSYGSGVWSRNQANSGDLLVIQTQAVNSVNNVLVVGSGISGTASSAGGIIFARSGGAAPNTTDLPAGFFTVWRDNGGATTKLYYNNGGAIQSVALA